MPIYGSIQSAGVQVREQDPAAPIQPAALGWAGYAGILKRGPVGELIVMANAEEATRKAGLYCAGSLLPDSIRHYFALAAGAGGVLAVRVTDGNETAASYTLFMRRDERTVLGRLDAKNGGRWGGAKARTTGQVALIGDINAYDIDTGVSTWTTDQWVGATLSLAGVSGVTWTVVGNDNTGVLTVASDADMAAALAVSDDPTNKRWYLELDNNTDYLSVVIGDGDSDSSGFSITVTCSDGTTNTWTDLTIDTWVSVINGDPNNHLVTAVQTWEGATDSTSRPANAWSEFTALTATTLTASIFEYEIDAGPGDFTVTLPGTTDDMVAQEITLDFSNATTYTATSDLFGALGTGTVGVTFTPSVKWCPPILVTANDVAPDATTNVAIVYKPLEPNAMAGGYVYPDPTQPGLRYRVKGNTHKVITVTSGSDMLADVAPTFGVQATGSITAVGGASLLDDEAFVLPRASANNEDITFFFDLGGAVTTEDATTIKVNVGGGDSAAVVAAAIKAAIVAVDGIKYDPGTIVGALIPLVYREATEDANEAITETVTNVGFVVSGMAGGVTATDTSFRAQYAAEFGGGRDGIADLTDSHYIEQAWNVLSSPFNEVRHRGYGLIKYATPGVTAAEVQKAGLLYATSAGSPAMPPHQYRYEIPVAYTTETDIIAYISDSLVRSHFAVVAAQGRCYVTDPENLKVRKQVSTTGFIHGREARIAADEGNYHKPAAGLDATLPGILSLVNENQLNEEQLNPKGIAVIKYRNGNFVVWGNKTLTANGLWSMKSQRELMCYYQHVLSESLEWVLFQLNDRTLWGALRASIRRYFTGQFNIRALRSPTGKVDGAFIIKIDDENNPSVEIDAGNLNVSIGLYLAAGVERVIVTMSKAGVSDNAA